MSQPSIGQILKGRYEIIKILGSGGFGDTYLAHDRDLPGSPKRVVKHLAPKGFPANDFHLAERLFKQEAELLYKLGEQHDQIPFLYAYFQEKGQLYLVQDFIEGHDLTQEIPLGQKIGEEATLELLEEILSILSFVHQNNVIHRDIKPQNIMRRERDGKLFLIDFGAVKEISVMTIDGTGQTSLTVGIGSPGFMPNEQANGRPKLSSDVYAVGMIGVQCLTGVPPHQLKEDQRTGEILWRQQSEVSESTAIFIDAMTRDHFSQRYPSAIAALEALNKVTPVEIEAEDILLLDVTPLSIGIEGMGGIMTKLIPRNTAIPTQKSKIFSTTIDDQSSIEIQLLQGEFEIARNNRSFATCYIDEIPLAPQGIPQIEVTFSLDANGILNVTANDKESGKELPVKMISASPLSDEDIDKMLN